MSIELVIARYNENLEWTKEEPFCNYNIIVYNKGSNLNFYKDNIKHIYNLPNVGMCDHTYMYHIIYKYHDLADITFFLPGSLNITYKKNIALQIFKIIQDKK
jgi:hypothetical protein